MAPRPVWKGQLRLSLVSIPVEMFSATDRKSRVSFREIHKPSGKPVRHEKMVPGVGPVKNEDIWKGYEVDSDDYVLIDPDDLEDIKLETRKTLELVQFVDITDIPPVYFDKPYFLSPTDELAEDAFRVVRDALRETGKAGIGQLAMRGQEYLAAVRPCSSGLLLETLHYEDEIRKTDPYFSSISNKKADKELLAVAKQLIEKKSGAFDAGAFKDHYGDAVRALVKERAGKRKGKSSRAEKTEERPSGDNVVDLMAALKQSVEKSGRKGGSKSPAGRKTKSSSGGGTKKSA